MNDFFTQLETELGTLTREGIHLGDASARGRRRVIVLLKRGVAIVALATALAVSLEGEFPAIAHGYAGSTLTAAQQA
jgi:hypothetical protein